MRNHFFDLGVTQMMEGVNGEYRIELERRIIFHRADQVVVSRELSSESNGIFRLVGTVDFVTGGREMVDQRQ
jgi:hypothetical protein